MRKTKHRSKYSAPFTTGELALHPESDRILSTLRHVVQHFRSSMTDVLDEDYSEAVVSLNEKIRDERLLREESHKIFLAFRSLLYVLSGKDEFDVELVVQVWAEYLIDDPNVGQDKVDIPKLLNIIRGTR